jgi:hypothetical protein
MQISSPSSNLVPSKEAAVLQDTELWDRVNEEAQRLLWRQGVQQSPDTLRLKQGIAEVFAAKAQTESGLQRIWALSYPFSLALYEALDGQGRELEVYGSYRDWDPQTRLPSILLLSRLPIPEMPSEAACVFEGFD